MVGYVKEQITLFNCLILFRNYGNLQFLVQGSSAEPYETFVQAGKELSASCTCQAGQNGSHCKHRLNILEGSQYDHDTDVIIIKQLTTKTLFAGEDKNERKFKLQYLVHIHDNFNIPASVEMLFLQIIITFHYV